MQNEIEILPAESNHRAAITALLQFEKLPVEDLPAVLNDFFTAADGNEVIGVAGLELYEGFGLLRSVVVQASYRNRAIAGKLVKAVEERAAALNLESIYLLTETAEAYFKGKGYTVTGRENVPEPVKRSSEFSHACPVTAIVMFKQIAQQFV
jgi:amino-acid N-acetyltransferase